MAQTKTLSDRDYAPLFNLANQNNQRYKLHEHAGKVVVLFFYASDRLPACQKIAQSFQAKIEQFHKLGVEVASIAPDSVSERAEFAQSQGISFPLLADQNAKICKEYGILHEQQAEGRTDYVFHRAIFLINPNLRIFKIYNAASLADPAAAVLSDITEMFPSQVPQHLVNHAPVLLIPNVISPEFCQELIDVWHTRGNQDSGFMRSEGEKTVGYLDYEHKIRRDHFVREGQLRDRIDRIMNRRVFPEIKKAFCYEVTRREAYKIACYNSASGGYFRPHRDNLTGGTAHRKFAMTLNLNVEEYEGGYLKFAEYGPHLYKPTTGSAVIFSCSLLHEATDVTAGIRFALLSFFYSDNEAQHRTEYETKAKNDYAQVVVKH
ncbi:alkyl hydroperoxide reductase/ Thiol specific antioxidant/ Mal allergen [Thalassoporum mexicanum PCC 7367]|uniref:redoxin domain-containing protein n=1 Tax=Thalassoporum mexicanum TaxID=3457544 RepID=UPI00029FC698|nr:redoxin domain-containing protein [Pseudanabaena sp. PCC 7367]AFY68536.1 alkyl hydroperoxide reductase/ Thiol specific antioxidant/ Mal allergen [Pseudanabaena sp. PCC 7367]